MLALGTCAERGEASGNFSETLLWKNGGMWQSYLTSDNGPHSGC